MLFQMARRSCRRPRIEEVIEQAAEIGFDHVQFTLGDRHWIRQVVNHSPALFLTKAATLLTGTPRMPPRPLAGGRLIRSTTDPRGVPGYPDFLCAGYRA